MTKTKGADHSRWLDELRSRPRDEAARMIAERYPHLSDEEIQRRLPLLDAPPPPIKTEPKPSKRVVRARAALSRAIARARNLLPKQQDDLSKKLVAKLEEARFDGL